MALTLERGQKLVVASHNEGKVRELRTLLSSFGLELVSAAELDLPEPEETGTTYEENAQLKAVAAAKGAQLWALADDSGLSVDALDGAPGIYSARWGGPERDFGAAMVKVHTELMQKGAMGPGQRTADFVAVLCLATPEGETACFEGRVSGSLVWPPRGTKGFGYDPMFLPEGENRTFGEMTEDEKHAWAPDKIGLSHRSRAFSKFVKACCIG